jgi:RimJ/RimL family protein N-acetyltransferase
MPGPAFLVGDVVELRTIELEDADFLQSVVNDPRVRRGLAADAPVTGRQEREWIESLGDDGGVKLLVCADGDPVGTISMQAPDEVWGVAELGYLLAPEAWGNGYATDAVACLCRYAFRERRLHKLYAQVYATNPASGRVLEKNGFQREGVLRREAFVEGAHVDVHRYGLLADEWDEA